MRRIQSVRTSFEVTLNEGSLSAWRIAIGSTRRGEPLPSSSPKEEESKEPILLKIRFTQVMELESFHWAMSVILRMSWLKFMVVFGIGRVQSGGGGRTKGRSNCLY